MKLLRYVIVVLTFITTSSNISAQEGARQIDRLTPRLLPASPNAASLGKYGDYAATSYNGLPVINIDLFTVESTTLKIPISISYHASGLKMNDHASWIGAGWSLSAGGVVSRQIVGKPDEMDYATRYSSELRPSVDACGRPDDIAYLKQIADGAIDARPDIWMYSIPGKSGRFLLSHRNQNPPFLFPDEPYKINFENIDRLSLTDDGGVVYNFGLPRDGIVHGDAPGFESTFGGTAGSVTSAYLSEIIAPNRRESIAISYQSLGNIRTTEISQYLQIIQDCNSSGEDGFTCPPESNLDVRTTASWISMNQVGIKSIVFESGRVDFIKSARKRLDESEAFSLDSMKIYSVTNGAYTLIKSFKFYHSYLMNRDGSKAIMLKLDSIRAFDASGEAIMRYKFGYTTNRVGWLSWEQNKYNRDYWGFYNGSRGADNRDLLLPRTVRYQHTMNSPIREIKFGTANRNVDTVRVKDGLLNYIEFPTGGFTRFEYEPNRYERDNSVAIAGGVRIKRILTYDGTNESPLIKRYKYGTAKSKESSMGVPNFNPDRFEFDNRYQIVTQCCGGALSCSSSTTPGLVHYIIRTWFSNLSYNSEGYGGAPVVYPYVTEYLMNSNGVALGKTRFEFDNGSYIPPGVDIRGMIGGGGGASGVSPNSYRNSVDWKSGRLTRSVVYDSLGRKTSETVVNYSLFNERQKHVGWLADYHRTFTMNNYCFSQRCGPLDNSTDPMEMAWAPIVQSTGALRETERIQYQYQADTTIWTSIINRTTYDPNKLQILKASSTLSDGGEIIQENRYPFSYETTEASGGALQAIHRLKQKNIVSLPVESWSYKQKGATKAIAEGQILTLRPNESQSSFEVPHTQYLLEPDDALLSGQSLYRPASPNAAGTDLQLDSRLKPRIRFLSYDQASNLSAYAKTNDVPVSFLYGYGGSKVIAEARNAFVQTRIIEAMVPGVLNEAVSIFGSIENPINLTKQLTVVGDGMVDLNISVPGNPSYDTYISYSGITSGNVKLDKNGCGITRIRIGFVRSGTYNLQLRLVTLDPDVVSLGACGYITYPGLIPGFLDQGVKQVFIENFEESNLSGIQTDPSQAHTGERFFKGDYFSTFIPPDSINYQVEYWYRQDGKWNWTSKPYPRITKLTEGDAIDDVRIYPITAQVKSFTHNPLLGPTSVIDENGVTTRYRYDKFGRLQFVINDRNELEKSVYYNYRKH